MIPTGHCRYDAPILSKTKYKTTWHESLAARRFSAKTSQRCCRPTRRKTLRHGCGAPAWATSEHSKTQNDTIAAICHAIRRAASELEVPRNVCGGHPTKVGFVAKVAGGFVDKLIPNPPPLTPPPPPAPLRPQSRRAQTILVSGTAEGSAFRRGTGEELFSRQQRRRKV